MRVIKITQKITFLTALLLVAVFFCIGKIPAKAANVYEENGFYYSLEYGEAYVEGYCGSSTTMNIPTKLGGCKVVGINSVTYGPYAGKVSTYDKVEHIIMPDTIEKDIECSLCGYSNNIKTVRLSSKVKKLGNSAFRAMKSLEAVTNTSGVEFIDYACFEDCVSLKEISFPNVTGIGGNVFLNCKSLTKASFPKLAKPSYSTFEDCVSLSSVTLSPKLEEISTDMFAGCVSLTSFTMPSSLKTIQVYAFCGTSLTTVNIPSSVTYINGNAFKNCKKLKTVYFNASDTNLRGDMFSGCSSLTKVTLPEGLTKIWWGAFRDCINLTTITIPSTVTSIDSSAFDNCERLTEIRGYENTEAQRFAKEKGIPFTAIPATITLNKTTVVLYPTSGFSRISLKVTKSGTNAAVKFTSSKPSVATVSSKGTVTAKKAGTTTITAKCGSLTAKCKVTVKKSSLKVSKTSVKVKKGKTVTLKVTVTPAGTVKFTSTNKKIATVTSKGVVKGKKKGTCYIKISMSGAATKKVKVTVR